VVKLGVKKVKHLIIWDGGTRNQFKKRISMAHFFNKKNLAYP
jgi:hypothetical protein